MRGAEGADPASVAFEAVQAGIDAEVDVVIIDTAGRLHTKTGLMDELGKVKRVVEKQAPVDEVLLVLDATTGQNGLAQARVFAEVVDVTGIVLTKLDGTAKGGIVVAVQRELGVPVKLVGLGEGADDLAPFDPEAFVSRDRRVVSEGPAEEGIACWSRRRSSWTASGARRPSRPRAGCRCRTSRSGTSSRMSRSRCVVKPFEDPVLPEPPRSGEGGAACWRCDNGLAGAMWHNDRWVLASLGEPLGLPVRRGPVAARAC